MFPQISVWDIFIQTLLLFWQVLVSLPLLIQLLLIASVVLPIAINLWEWRKLAKSGIREIDQMDGRTFEKYIEILFTRLGFQVTRTRYKGDYGADLVTVRDGVKTVIQVKRFRGNVGVKAVQEAVAAKGYYGCGAAMVVTNSFYTKQAIALAEANDVELWDRKDLIETLLSLDKDAKDETIETTSEELTLPRRDNSVCVVCGKSVSGNVKRFCLSNSQRFGDQVYCYEHQRSHVAKSTTSQAKWDNR